MKRGSEGTESRHFLNVIIIQEKAEHLRQLAMGGYNQPEMSRL
ncbi:MAG: hypothetical protein U9N61_00065 [Euryarchaeota archaeon]|nr:hypothetical protein [Euryarchaeota archaeon]